MYTNPYTVINTIIICIIIIMQSCETQFYTTDTCTCIMCTCTFTFTLLLLFFSLSCCSREATFSSSSSSFLPFPTDTNISYQWHIAQDEVAIPCLIFISLFPFSWRPANHRITMSGWTNLAQKTMAVQCFPQRRVGGGLHPPWPWGHTSCMYHTPVHM